LDRQERGGDRDLSAVQEVREQFGIPVIAVISLQELIQYMHALGRSAELAGMHAYRERYGVEN